MVAIGCVQLERKIITLRIYAQGGHDVNLAVSGVLNLLEDC
jgi:hypothetical protein